MTQPRRTAGGRRSMTPDEVERFIDSHPGWAALTTIGRDGYPHTVPIGYLRIGDDLYFGCRPNTQKTKNVERNHHASAMFEAGSTRADIRGVMVQGDADIVSEPAAVLDVAREAARRRGVPEADLPTEPRPGAVYIRIRRTRVISWTHEQVAE